MSSKKVLYISYDGMTDSLGQSQVLPYLTGLSKRGYDFTILSFEKKEKFLAQKQAIEKIVNSSGIEWVPLSFTTKPPIVSKFYDAIRMKHKAFTLQRIKKFDIIHCRSYIAADIGLAMKRKFGTKFFFDMRGFWADEKKDGGSWSESHPVFKRVYKYYKKREADYLQNADHIISLTEAGKLEMQTWDAYRPGTPLTVIPCCADMGHFTLTNSIQKFEARQKFQIKNNSLVISYLGSVGAWYMLDEMLKLFTHIKKAYPEALFLFITHSDKDYVKKAAAKYSIDPSDIIITEAKREDVPLYVKASDVNISFIKPVYSKISSSPTKLGEVLSMGIPVIVNAGVGDVERIVNQTNSGVVLKDFSQQSMEAAVEQIPDLLKLDASNIREKAKTFFDLDKGISLYESAYCKLFT